MKITIQLDDVVAELYESRLRPNQTLEQILAVQLARFQEVDPRDRILIIIPSDRRRLEELTTRMPLLSVTDLIKRISDLAELSIGQIRFRFTPTQWRELKHRAERWRMQPRAYAEKVVKQIEAQFFNEVPRGSIAVPQVKKEKKEGPDATQGL
jgi:hypothetical protein